MNNLQKYLIKKIWKKHSLLLSGILERKDINKLFFQDKESIIIIEKAFEELKKLRFILENLTDYIEEIETKMKTDKLFIKALIDLSKILNLPFLELINIQTKR